MMTKRTTTDRAAVLDGLRRFIDQRSGIDARNYIRDWRDSEGRRAFGSDRYAITRDGRDARRLLAFVDGIDIDVATIADATRGGRLELSEDGREWSYTAGQYFCTEYRAAACCLLARLVWQYLRDIEGTKTADDIRRRARGIFGRGIASRWFR